MIQENRLRRLLRHAYSEVPYYRRLFDRAGVRPEELETARDLARLPVTSKADIQALPIGEVTARGMRLEDCRLTRTSGSTGEPLSIYQRPHDGTMTNFSMLRCFFAYGAKPWDSLLEILGREEVRPKHWYEYLGFLRRFYLSGAQTPEEWASQASLWRPDILLGYSLNLRLFAEVSEGLERTDKWPKLIVSTSGTLDRHTRNLLERTFNARVADLYASAEGGFLAWECPRCHGYHINSDMAILEFLKDGKPVAPGEEGEIVITNLFSFAMPFIRYRQEDVGIPSEENSSCGRGLPLMRAIVGRSADFIRLPRGGVLSPHPFFIALDGAEDVARWRIIQEKDLSLHVQVVPKNEFSRNALKKIESDLSRLVKAEVPVHVEMVSEIVRRPFEKFRSVISRVSESEGVTP